MRDSDPLPPPSFTSENRDLRLCTLISAAPRALVFFPLSSRGGEAIMSGTNDLNRGSRNQSRIRIRASRVLNGIYWELFLLGRRSSACGREEGLSGRHPTMKALTGPPKRRANVSGKLRELTKSSFLPATIPPLRHQSWYITNFFLE